MQEFFVETFGISPKAYTYGLLPALIFLARVCDVSINTIRIIFVLDGKRLLAPLLGFFESLIWLLAIGQIIQNIDNAWSYLAYASGFATGTFVGMVIEEKLALGRVVIRVITRVEAKNLIKFLQEHQIRFANLPAEGNDGKVNVLFSVVKRERLQELIAVIKHFNPNAFYTVEGVKRVSEEFPTLTKEEPGPRRPKWFKLLRSRP